MKVQERRGFTALETGLVECDGEQILGATDGLKQMPCVVIEGMEAASYGVGLQSLLELLKNSGDDQKSDGRAVFCVMLQNLVPILTASMAHAKETAGK